MSHPGHQQQHHDSHGHHNHHAHPQVASPPGTNPDHPQSTGNDTPATVHPPLERLTKMVEHWLHHNEDHAQSFYDWAGRARELGQLEVATLIEDVARQSLMQNDQLQKALQLLKTTPGKNA